MPALSITRELGEPTDGSDLPAGGDDQRGSGDGSGRTHPRAYLITEHGRRVVLSYTSVEVAHAGGGAVFDLLDRPGRKPLVRRSGDGVKTMQFTALLDAGGAPIEDLLAKLRDVTRVGARVRFVYGRLEAGWWRLSGLSINTRARAKYTNRVTRADITVDLVEAYDPRPAIGTSAPPPPANPPGPGPPPPQTRYHTVAAGDSLWAIAVRYLGTGVRWREIATLNGITDPRRLQIGTVLAIPPT